MGNQPTNNLLAVRLVARGMQLHVCPSTTDAKHFFVGLQLKKENKCIGGAFYANSAASSAL